MSRFAVEQTPLPGLVVLQRQPIGDERGFFERLFCAEELAATFGKRPIAQINRTLTQRCGALRGMHFQRPPHSETKLVSCLKGKIFDVAVDLRAGSPTFLHWHGEILSAENHRSLLIPEGFAHGFQSLCDDCELLYLHSAFYEPAAEDGMHHADPALGIQWPLPITETSARDAGFPPLSKTFKGLQP